MTDHAAAPGAGPASSGTVPVRLRGVTKRFGAHAAVSDLDLEIPPGTVYGLLGPNGSGKTTTLRMILGILLPDEGSVALFGAGPDVHRSARVGYLPEERGVYRKMKVGEFLAFLGEIHGVPRRPARERAGAWLRRLGLGDWKEKRVQDLSKGMQQKVQFIGTVLHEPDLLILDEPFSGLDPINQDVLEEIVLELRGKGTTVLFSTHLMDQAERLCERVCLVSRGRKVLDGELRAIKRNESRGVVAVRAEGPDGWLDGPEVVRREAVGDAVHLLLREGADPGAVLARGVEAGAAIRRFELVEPRLHEIFVRHVGPEAADDAGLPPPGPREAP